MRRLLLLVLAVSLLTVPGRGTLAAWTDPTPPQASTTLDALTLAAPVLSCSETTGPLGSNAATVSWTPSTVPTALSYASLVVDDGQPLSVVGNSSAQIYPNLLATLFGTTVTVRVTGTLPGTLWTTSAERTVVVGLAGLYVNCS